MSRDGSDRAQLFNEARPFSGAQNPNRAVYDRVAKDWEADRQPVDYSGVDAFAESLREAFGGADGGTVSFEDESAVAENGISADSGTPDSGPLAKGSVCLDLGCGPGWYASRLPTPVVAVDSSLEMLRAVPRWAPNAQRVAADLRYLPFRESTARGVLASKCYLHLPKSEVPMALAELHRATAVGALVELVCIRGDQEWGTLEGDDFPGRWFSMWEPDHLRDVVVGAGFEVISVKVADDAKRRHGHNMIILRARRIRSLADTVGSDMRLLICGLNPSLYAADRGVGFARGSNRFWKAALQAGIVSKTHDPAAAFRHDRIGMTDIAKRATRRADEITASEFKEGIARLERLVQWLKPQAICFVGLTGWREALSPEAQVGPQPQTLGGSPIYVMQSTSGANAHATLHDLTDQLKAATEMSDSFASSRASLSQSV